MKTRLISLLICLAILLSAAPMAVTAAETTPYSFTAVEAHIAADGTEPMGGNSAGSQNYDTWSSPVTTAFAAENGGYTLASYKGGSILVEFYDNNFTLLSSKSIELPLPIFGGIYICNDYNFVVCGQYNRDQCDTREVIRVIRYSKNWDNPVSCGLYGGNTTEPFNAGSLRFARSGNNLYIRTCHEMYRTSDGLNHQANLTMIVNVSAMSITDSLYAISNSGRGYVSHSFNQFIIADGSTIVGADHGDAIPRSIVLSRYNSAGSVSGKAQSLDAFPIAENLGHYNGTGVSLGGFDYSDTHYILAGNSCPQTGGIYQDNARRNIFVTAVNKNSYSASGTVTTFITDYPDTDPTRPTTPQLVKISNNEFMLLWGVKNDNSLTYFCTLNGNGTRTSDIYCVENCSLSDCPPICVDGEVMWVTNASEGPTLYRLSLVHNYTCTETAPTCTETGKKDYYCSHCGKSFTEIIPATGHNNETEIDQPRCDEVGSAYHKCLTCGYTSTEILQPKEHQLRYGDTIYPSCTEDGVQKYICSVCGDEESSVIKAEGHIYEIITREATCTQEGGTFNFCYICWDEVGIETTPALGHDKVYNGNYPGTCVTAGKEYYRCTRCNEHFTEEGEYGDHYLVGCEWENATCTRDGYVLKECSYCDYEQKDIVPATGHDYYLYTFFPASCASEGSETYKCLNCFASERRVTPKTAHNFVNNKCTDCGRLSAYEERVAINYRRIKIVLDGEEIIPCDGAGTTVEPFIMSSSGTTYLPLRAVSQALGLNVQWDGIANTVTLTSGGTVKTGAGPAGKTVGEKKTYITYRNIKVFLDGQELSLVNSLGVTVEPFILNSNSSVYLPLRIIGEALGIAVSWDGNTSTVYLSTGK